jgi:hypothetical protein
LKSGFFNGFAQESPLDYRGILRSPTRNPVSAPMRAALTGWSL